MKSSSFYFSSFLIAEPNPLGYLVASVVFAQFIAVIALLAVAIDLAVFVVGLFDLFNLLLQLLFLLSPFFLLLLNLLF